MASVLFTAPIIEPITLDDVKLHLRVDGTDEDEYLEGLIKTAREQVETLTQRALLTQTWDYFLDSWPDENYIKLPFGNLVSVTSVKYKDSAGTETTMVVTTAYLVETNGAQCGRIVLPYMVSWPVVTLYPSNPITVRFVCGWTTAELVPFRIKEAIKMICSKHHESRGEDVVGQTVSEDKTVDRLLNNVRLYDKSL